ncbi:hypothetical protein KSS87_017061 [Heliosperma pusillum]|nr:hypothetical protein KSS87_017061 [Heliosperma pusillum]
MFSEGCLIRDGGGHCRAVPSLSPPCLEKKVARSRHVKVHVPFLMDFLDDLFSEPPAANVASRFKPKAKAKPKKQPKKALPVASQSVVVNATEEQPSTVDDVVKDKSEALTTSSETKIKDTDTAGFSTTDEWPGPSETPALDVPSIQNETGVSGFPDVSFASSSPIRSSTIETTHDLSIPLTQQDAEDIQINVEQLEAGDFSCLDAVEMMNEAGGASGKRTSKLKPKPKALSRAKDMAETPSEDVPVIDGSVHVDGLNSDLYSSQSGLDGNFSMNPTEDQSQNAVFENTESLVTSDMSQQTGEHRKFNRMNSPGNIPDEGPVLSGVEANGNTFEFVDGTNDGFDVNSKSPTNVHDELASNREENDNSVHSEETKSKKKRRRTKNTALENDKSAGKRKKASKKSDQSIVQPPKKFPRGTRRKRCVDKTLLEIPEDELDLHRVSLRDMILLGEYREREAKKQSTSVQPTPSNERTDNLQSEGYPYDDDAFEFDQDRDLNENPSTSGVQTDTGYYNYNSFRKVQPRPKWTKMETELFYKGIRQFGTDLSMIQQLFPGRSLEQIRSKFRKEQKQNPMMMHDAQTSKATDNSCFELVIKTLEADREAEDDYDSNDDNVGEPTGNEGKPEDNIETHGTPEETANPEHNPKDEAASKDEAPSKAPDRAEDRFDDDDDDDDWGDFTSL